MSAARSPFARRPRKSRALALGLSATGLLGLILACQPEEATPEEHGAGVEAGEALTGFPWTDATQSSGLDFVLRSGAVPPTQILEVKGGGLALFDWNADGELDLFVPNGASLELSLIHI